jgi:hypothetical protein
MDPKISIVIALAVALAVVAYFFLAPSEGPPPAAVAPQAAPAAPSAAPAAKPAEPDQPK